MIDGTGELKEETEGFTFAAQDQAPRTNAVKENVSSKCRMRGRHDETVQHILGNSSKLRETEYKKRLLGGSYIGRRARNMDLSAVTNEHSPKSVKENEEVKLLWDFSIQTDREIHHKNSEKEGKGNNHCGQSCSRIYVLQKETEKYEKYQDLAREIKRIWKSRTKVVPVVVGTSCPVSKKLAGH